MNTIPTPIADSISSRWEHVYLDQGGVLTLEQRDKAFVEALTAVRQLERELATLLKKRKIKRWKTKQ
jgi:hypothetical protein